jgi:allantoin racemase
MTRKLKFILPVPLSGEAASRFAAQIPQQARRPGTSIDFIGCRAGGQMMDSEYESTLAAAFVVAAGAKAEQEGYAAVCSFSMSDTGLGALRSRLSIPVIGTAQASFALAQQLGKKISVLTMWKPWAQRLRDNVERYGLSERLASIRHINMPPDTQALLSEDESVLIRLKEQALVAIEEDGADVIILGSTTMYKAYSHLAKELPCPVVNPGLAAYQACETILDLGLSHSKIGYPSPSSLLDDIF